MNEDPYKILGVPNTATHDEIKKAYRKLAKSLHPDLHPDDPGKQAEFQAVSAAHDLLGDPEKRRRFDAGEIDASGQERAQREYYHHYAGQDAGERYGGNQGFGAGGEDLSDLFSELFGRHRRGRPDGRAYHEFHARGQDLHYHLAIEFLDAALGARKTATLPDGKSIEITIPTGVRKRPDLAAAR